MSTRTKKRRKHTQTVQRSANPGARLPFVVEVRDLAAPHPHLILFTLSLLVFTSSTQVLMLAPLLPRIGVELGIRESLLGTLVSADAALVAVFALLVGPVSDRIGRRRVLLVGSAVLTLALALHALAAGYLSLLAVRALAGAAGGVLSGAAVSYIGDFFPYERRGWANGWVMGGMALGQIAGIPLGILLATRHGFRAPFLMLALAGGATLLLVWKVLPQPPVRVDAEPLSFCTMRRNYRQLLGRREVMAGGVVFLLLSAAYGLFVIYLPTWLQVSHGASAAQIATLFFVGGIANVVVGPQAGKLSDRIGRKRVIIASSVGFAAVAALTTVVVSRVWMAYVVFFAAMALIAARVVPFRALFTAIASDDRRGTLISLIVSFGQLGYALGGALAGAAYAQRGYASSTWLAAAALLLASSLAGRFLPEPARASAGEDAAPIGQERRSPARLARLAAGTVLQ